MLARLDDVDARAALALAEAQAEAARRAVTENEVRLAEAQAHAQPADAAARRTASSRRPMSITAQAEVDSIDARIDALRAAGAASPSGRSSCSRPISTTRSSARRSAASRSRRTRSPARWCRRCRPAAASRARASARSSTCARSRSKWTSTRATSTACSPGSSVDGGARRLSRTGRFRRTSSRRCRRPIARRRRCSCASAFEQLDPRILPDMGVKVTFLARGGREAAGADARPVDARAEGRRSQTTDGQQRSSSSSTATRRTPRRQASAAPTAIGSKCSPASAQASASSCRRRQALTDGDRSS